MLYKAHHLYTDGTQAVVEVDHDSLHEYLGGSLTFVGAIPELNLVAVAREGLQNSQEAGARSAWSQMMSSYLDDDVRGDVVLVVSDSNGEAGHSDEERFAAFLSNLAEKRRRTIADESEEDGRGGPTPA